MFRIRSARVMDLPGVATVLQDAFEDKLRIIFGNQPHKIRAVLEAVYTGPVQRGYDGVLIAEQNGRIIGALLIEPMNYTPQETRRFESIAIREFGVPRMVVASFLLWLIGHRPEPDEAYISDLGVASNWQDQGVGQDLIAEADQWARDHDRDRLTLWVADNNRRAVHVYEKSGFAITQSRSSWLTRLAFGIRHWHFMEKPLTGLRYDEPDSNAF